MIAEDAENMEVGGVFSFGATPEHVLVYSAQFGHHVTSVVPLYFAPT